MQLTKTGYVDKTIHVCVHCGTYPAVGMYCPDCKTAEKRKELDKIQLADFGVKQCKCKTVDK